MQRRGETGAQRDGEGQEKKLMVPLLEDHFGGRLVSTSRGSVVSDLDIRSRTVIPAT